MSRFSSTWPTFRAITTRCSGQPTISRVAPLILSRSVSAWTKDEIDIVKNYLQSGNVGIYLKQLLDSLPGRSYLALVNKAGQIRKEMLKDAQTPKLVKQHQRKWTSEEHNTLWESKLAGHTLQEAARRFPGRSLYSIRSRWWALDLYLSASPERAGRGALWTPSEAEELCRLRNEHHLSWPAIASRMQRSAGAAYEKYFALSASTTNAKYSRKWSERDEALLIEMRQEGRSIAQIALKLDRTYESTQKHWRAIEPHAKIPKARKRGPKCSPEEAAAMLQLHRQGLPNGKIAAKVDRSQSTVRKYLSLLMEQQQQGSVQHPP